MKFGVSSEVPLMVRESSGGGAQGMVEERGFQGCRDGPGFL